MSWRGVAAANGGGMRGCEIPKHRATKYTNAKWNYSNSLWYYSNSFYYSNSLCYYSNSFCYYSNSAIWKLDEHSGHFHSCMQWWGITIPTTPILQVEFKRRFQDYIKRMQRWKITIPTWLTLRDEIRTSLSRLY